MIRLMISLILSFLIAFMPGISYAQGLRLPEPGATVSVTPAFTPSRILGVNIDPHRPLNFSFIISHGDEAPRNEPLLADAKQMIRYFFAAMTVPETELWVNLSPYEKNRIITDSFGSTEMGRDLLAQDYILKQLSASLMSPDEKIGKEFWTRVYAQAQARFGTTDIPFDTFNKIWIQPQDAVVYEHAKGALIVRSHLKVLLEQDYLATTENRSKQGITADAVVQRQGDTAAVVREVLIPAIEREVNEGRLFAKLRQIYSAVIMAKWYKKSFSESLLGKVYVDRDKTAGIAHHEPRVNQAIYDRYVDAFKSGVCNFIKEEYDPSTKAVLPRKYFTGGATFLETPVTGYDGSKKDQDALKEVLGDSAEQYDVVINTDASQNDGTPETWNAFVEALAARPAIISELYTNPVFARKVADWRNGIQDGTVLTQSSRLIAKAVAQNVDKVSMEALLAAMEAIHPEGQSGHELIGVVGSHDDGGYSSHIQAILRQAGYGVLAPIGDQINLLQGLMDVIIQKHMMADHVRLVKDYQGTSFLTAILPYVQEAFENQDVQITPDFFVTLFAFMKAIKKVDTLNENLISHGGQPLMLATASIRNIVHLGFQLEYGIVATHNRMPSQSAVSSKVEQQRYAQAMDALSILSGLGSARVTVSSFEPRTMVAVYSGTTFLFRQNGVIKVLTVEKDQDGDLLLSLPETGGKPRVIKDGEKTSLAETKIFEQGVPDVEFLNKSGALVMQVAGQSWKLEDDDLNDPRFVDVSNSDTQITLAFDGTGRAREKQGSDDKTPLFKLDGNVDLFVRPRVAKTQTAITESVSYLRITHMGFLNEASGLEGRISSNFLKGKRPAPNKILLERIAKGAEKPGVIIISGGSAMASLWQDVLKQLPGAGKERDMIIISPASFYTSILLPHFMVDQFPEALRDAKKRGADIVFVMNATPDNETIGLSPFDMLKMIETYAGLKLDQMISAVMVAENVPVEQRSAELQRAANQPIVPEIRTNPAANSKMAKMARGLLMMTPADQQKIKESWPEIVMELLKTPFHVITKQGRDNQTESHVYYNKASVTKGLSNIIREKEKVDLNSLVSAFREKKIISMLEWNKAFSSFAALPRVETIRIVVTGRHEDLNKPYVREFFIPRDSPDRDVLLKILQLKIVSMATGVVGAAELGIYVEEQDSVIFNSLKSFFEKDGAPVAHYLKATFGTFEIKAIAQKDIPVLPWSLPLDGVRSEKSTFRFEPKDVFVGIAVNATGVDVALLDYEGHVQQNKKTGWGSLSDGKQVKKDPKEFTKASEIVDVVVAAVESAWRDISITDAHVTSVGVSVAAAVINNNIIGNASFISGLAVKERSQILPLLEQRLKESTVVSYSSEGVISAMHDGVVVALHNIVAREKSPENNTVVHLFAGNSVGGAVENQENSSVVPLELGKIVMNVGGAQHDVLGIAGMSQQFGPTLRLFAQLMGKDASDPIECLKIFETANEDYRKLSLLKATGNISSKDVGLLNTIDNVFMKMGEALADLIANVADDIGQKKFSVMLNGEILKSMATGILIAQAKERLTEMGLDIELVVSSAHGESLAVNAANSSMLKANDMSQQHSKAEEAVKELLRRSVIEENVPMYEWDALLQGFATWSKQDISRVVLVPQQKGFDKPYAYEAYIPKQLSAEVRQALIERLKEKAVSLVAGLLGAETLAIYSEDDAIYQDIFKYFQDGEPGQYVSTYVRNIFGKFNVERLEKEGDIPEELFRMPRGVPLDTGKDNEPDPQKVYFAFDLGRSDLKASLKTSKGVVSYRKKWTTGYDTGKIEEKNGREFTSSREHIRFLTEVAQLLFAKAKKEGGLSDDYVVAGVGMSVNAAVYDGQIVGAVESFKGLTDEDRRENIRPLLTRTIASMRGSGINIVETPQTALWNDGNASAAADILSHKKAYKHQEGFDISLGTGTAGGYKKFGAISPALTEMGKLVVDTSKNSFIPAHDQVKVNGVGQGLSGNQRNFVYIIKKLLHGLPEGQELFKTFDVREDILSGDAGRERTALEALQQKYDNLHDRSNGNQLSSDEQADYDRIKFILTSMGEFLAKYLMALSDYVRTKSFTVTLTGKTTEGQSGEFMKTAAEDFLNAHGFDVELVLSEDAEYGQATGMAMLVQAMDNLQQKAKQGGVDFQITDDKMEIRRSGSGIQFDVPADVTRFENIQVFIPEITGSVPIPDLKQFIGLPGNVPLGIQTTSASPMKPDLVAVR